MTGSAWWAAVYRCPSGTAPDSIGWQERLPADAGSELAERYRQRWLLRPPSPPAADPVRIGVVHHASGGSELLVAGWADGIAALDRLATRLLDGAGVALPVPADAGLAADPGQWARPIRLTVPLPPGDWAPAALASRIQAAIAGRPGAPGIDSWQVAPDATPAPEAGADRVAVIRHPVAGTIHFSLEGRPASTQLNLACDSAEGSTDPALLAELLGEIATAAERPAPPAPAVSPLRIDERVLQAARTDPDAVAVVHPTGRLSYRELVGRARIVADRLTAASVGRGDLVGVSLPRGEHLVPALLGTMLAGAAYVPLDPSYPADRLAYLTADADLAAVIALDGEPDAARTVIDPRPGTTRLPDVPVDHRPDRSAEDAAYVIYTSGSTGNPKGVVVEHRNVAALLAATEHEYGLGPDDVWTMFHSYAFDFSVWEIWGCLCTGGRLVIVPGELTAQPQDFRQLLHTEGVTVLNQTPSAFTQLLTTEDPAADELAVRLLVFGGEKLDARLLLGWFDRHPESRCRVMNMYGITETTVHSTLYELRRLGALRGTHSVGVALGGWRLYVLDDAGEPVPPGAFGEIYVGGSGVARGYLNRPALTAQRFVPDHLSGLAGARLYRSGDRGRLRADGQIEHHGRLDGQVKVRGYRIELDEIASRIQAIDGVTGAVVVLANRGEHQDAHLDAYLVGPGVSPEQVRRRLAAELPSYMLPSTVTVIDRLPLTSNGKVDRAKLPAPSIAAPGSDHEPATGSPAAEPGQDGIAAQLTAIWQRVLGVAVGDSDNFFLVGGNSLLAIRLMTSLREAGLAGGRSVRLIYENPTVAELAHALA